jgi:hypothetical protein
MIVRIRLETGPPIRKTTGKNRHVASAVAALLWPAIFTAYVLGVWALAAQIRVTEAFGIPQGFFSHWQVWVAGGISLHVGAAMLNRYGRDNKLL